MSSGNEPTEWEKTTFANRMWEAVPDEKKEELKNADE